MQNSPDLVSLCVGLVLARWWNSKLHCHITFSSTGIVNRVESLKFTEQSPVTGASEANSPKWIVKLQIWLCWVWKGDLQAAVNSQNFRNFISTAEGEPQTLLPPRFNIPCSHLPPDVHLTEGRLFCTDGAQGYFSWVLLGELLENVSIKQSFPKHDKTSIIKSGSSVTVGNCFLQPSC